MLFIIVIITALCSIIYELLLSTLSSYLLGNTILQFSLTIGFFLLGLGIGANLSKYIKNHELTFLKTEIILGLLGGISIIFIKFLYLYLIDYEIIFQTFYLSFVTIIGILTGLELPLIGTIINKKNNNFQKTIGDIFSFDYIGSLIGTILFPLLLLPWFGLTYTAIIIAILNLLIALIFLKYINISNKLKYSIYIISSIIFLILLGFFYHKYLEKIRDHLFYKEPIIYSSQSKYQKIVLTKRGEDIRLFLDGHLQFLSLDEKRYHNGLTYFPKQYIQTFSGNKLDILILGGGDGLAIRNLLNNLKNKKFNFKIYLVELDSVIIDLFTSNKILTKLNENSLTHPKVKIIINDAYKQIINFYKQGKKFDIIIADFPDPRNENLSKLYSLNFYKTINNILKKDGIFVTQASNAFFAKESFWCIYKTIKNASNNTKIIPYHVYIPSFGDWGFVALLKGDSKKLYKDENIAINGLINFKFDSDYKVNLNEIEINKLDKPVILKYYIQGWKRRNL